MAAFSLAVCPTAAHTASAADGKKRLPSPATAIERRREPSGWRGQAPWWRKTPQSTDLEVAADSVRFVGDPWSPLSHVQTTGTMRENIRAAQARSQRFDTRSAIRLAVA